MANLSATGLLSINLFANSLTSPSNLSAGTTLLINPTCSASLASISSPVNISSNAFFLPINLGKSDIATAGRTPIFISGVPNRASSEAITMSQDIASSHPPPRANPFTAAIVGLPRFVSARESSPNLPRKSRICRVVLSLTSLRSAPALNTRSPAPVKTTTLTSLSFFASSIAEIISKIVSVLNAFNTFGLFIVIVAMPSSFLKRIFSKFISIISL